MTDGLFDTPFGWEADKIEFEMRAEDDARVDLREIGVVVGIDED